MAKNARKTRTLDPFRSRLPTRKSAGQIRREDQEKARKEFPELVYLFEEIKADLRENLATGKRFAYRISTQKMYKLICEWEEEDCLADQQKAIARLRGVPLLQTANRFSGIVAICSDQDRRTVSRWSKELDRAFEMEIPPRRLIRFLKDPSSLAKTMPSLGKTMRWGA